MTPPDIHQRIRLHQNPHRVRVLYQNHVIADSDEVLVLQEEGLPPVQYFPREDVSMEYMSKTDRGTHCPYKGDASYYTILMDGAFAENALWSYEEPLAGMEAIRGRVAFYPDKVEIYELAGEDRDSPPLRDDPARI
jgi:uncharacterized protein (DUF427 family)